MNKYILINDCGAIIAQNMNRDFLISEAKEMAKIAPGCKYFLAVVELEFEAPTDGVAIRRL